MGIAVGVEVGVGVAVGLAVAVGVEVGAGVNVAVGEGVIVGVGVGDGVGKGSFLPIFAVASWRRPNGLSGLNTHASYTSPPNVIKAGEYCHETMLMKPRRTSMSVSFGKTLG